jgi:hypothetical protein
MGVIAVGLEAMTIEEGIDGLRACEGEKGYKMLKPMIAMRRMLNKIKFPCLHPSYLGPVNKHLGYVLAPTPFEATRPRGGLPFYVDILVPLINFGAEDIWIAATNRFGYFPRSADGERFITPKQNNGCHERGLVLGSSTLPVPKKYSKWPVVPNGDHMEFLPNYKTIACAGGAGIVQTARACGCKVVTFTQVIDRMWFDPGDAGEEVKPGQYLDMWGILALHYYPFKFIKWTLYHPRALYHLFFFEIKILTDRVRFWPCLFIGYCLSRSTYIQPTLSHTIWNIIFKGSDPMVVVLLSFITNVLINEYRIKTRTTYARIYWRIIRKAIILASRPMFTYLCLLGIRWIIALIITYIWTCIPDPVALYDEVRLGVVEPAIDDGVWMFFTPVTLWRLPIGLHVGLYDCKNGIILEGTHISEPHLRIGEQFRFITRPAPNSPYALCFKTRLESDELPTHSTISKPYSFLWNCQTMIAQIIIANPGSIGLLGTICLAIGVTNAVSLLIIGTVLGFFAACGTLICTYVLINSRQISPDWANLFDELETTIRRSTMVGAEFDDSQISQLTDAATDLIHSALLDGVDESVAFEAMIKTIGNATGGGIDIEEIRRREYNVLEYTGSPNSPLINLNMIVPQLIKYNVPLWCIEGLVRVLGNFLYAGEQLSTASLITVSKILAIVESYIPRRLIIQLDDLFERLTMALEIDTSRKKNAWVPIPFKNAEHTTFADWVALSLADVYELDDGDPFESTVKYLNQFKPRNEDQLLEKHFYQRPTYRPKRPRVTRQELEYRSLLHETAYRIDPKLQERVNLYESLGATVGIDGIWLADKEWQDENIKYRYLSQGKPFSTYEFGLMSESVDMLYQHHKDAFDNPAIVTPETVARNLVLKYSSGLPFMQRYRRRNDLVKHGWMDALIQSTYSRLAEGKVPQQLYHNFPKMQIVTKPRMVTAEGLASSFISQVTQLEPDKRPVWKQANMGMGAPINATYLGEVFEKIEKRNKVFTADVTDYDSNAPPILFEGLLKLRELGARVGGVLQVPAIQRKRYFALQNSKMVNLETGTVLEKNRGGGTGQSATSWDNHWGFRLSMVMMWSHATGKPPDQFYKYNTVHNTGDDNIWGTDSNVSEERLVQAAKDILGFQLKIETQGELENQSYLSRICRRSADFPEDLKLVNVKTKFVGVFDRKRILLRRSAIVSRFSAKPKLQFTKHLLQRSIGHMMNCAFDHEIYAIILREYMEDADAFVGHNKPLLWNCRYDDSGRLIGATPQLLGDASKHCMKRFKKLKSSLKAPNYVKVLEVATKEHPVPSPISKHYKSRVTTTFDIWCKATVTNWRASIYKSLPDYLARMKISQDQMPISPLIYIPGYPVEKYTWLSWYLKGEDLTQQELIVRVREGPFAPATDVNGFWWLLQTEGYKQKIIEEGIVSLRGRMTISLICYFITNYIIRILQNIPLVDTLVNLFMIYSRDLPRWYSFLSSFYWVGTGTVSRSLAALMPRDPYANLKVIAVAQASTFSNTFCAIIGSLVPVNLIETLNQILSLGLAYRPFYKAEALSTGIMTNPWCEIMDELEVYTNKNKHVVIMSPTATGKSTFLPAAIALRWTGRIWLILPRIILRDNYQNPMIASSHIQKLSRGVTDDGGRIKVATYGHLLSRIAAGNGPDIKDTILFDEFHECEPDQGLALKRLGGYTVLLLSATPNLLYCPNAPVFTANLARPHGEVEVTRLDLDIMSIFLEAERELGEEYTKRALIIIPQIRAANKIMVALQSSGREAGMVSGNQRNVPTSGIIVATQVVDAGIDIDPPVTIVIDSGKRIVQHEGLIQTWDTDLAVDEQRRGRAGRRMRGYSYTTKNAGTGRQPTIYPTWAKVFAIDDDREYLFRMLGIKCDFVKQKRQNNPDPFMWIRGNHSWIMQRSLFALWLARSMTGSLIEADTMYDKIIRMGYDDVTDFISVQLAAYYKNTYILPRDDLYGALARQPFLVTKGKRNFPVNALRIRSKHVIHE